ncbi:uncharacterized protein VTP21DRAFT_11282 [Calcarisporiella thermophila]|uniref:uncharacterized protein n=1 Tax=Calcarisporiella thermophila TaxID=911321 RepID=UPI00374387B0
MWRRPGRRAGAKGEIPSAHHSRHHACCKLATIQPARRGAAETKWKGPEKPGQGGKKKPPPPSLAPSRAMRPICTSRANAPPRPPSWARPRPEGQRRGKLQSHLICPLSTMAHRGPVLDEYETWCSSPSSGASPRPALALLDAAPPAHGVSSKAGEAGQDAAASAAVHFQPSFGSVRFWAQNRERAAHRSTLVRFGVVCTTRPNHLYSGPAGASLDDGRPMAAPSPKTKPSISQLDGDLDHFRVVAPVLREQELLSPGTGRRPASTCLASHAGSEPKLDLPAGPVLIFAL